MQILARYQWCTTHRRTDAVSGHCTTSRNEVINALFCRFFFLVTFTLPCEYARIRFKPAFQRHGILRSAQSTVCAAAANVDVRLAALLTRPTHIIWPLIIFVGFREMIQLFYDRLFAFNTLLCIFVPLYFCLPFVFVGLVVGFLLLLLFYSIFAASVHMPYRSES